MEKSSNRCHLIFNILSILHTQVKLYNLLHSAVKLLIVIIICFFKTCILLVNPLFLLVLCKMNLLADLFNIFDLIEMKKITELLVYQITHIKYFILWDTRPLITKNTIFYIFKILFNLPNLLCILTYIFNAIYLIMQKTISKFK